MEKYTYAMMGPLFREYNHIMNRESKLNPKCEYFSTRPSEIYMAINYLIEVAKSSTLLRGWCHAFSLTENCEIAYESDGAHTNLMMAMVDRALIAIYGPKFEDFTKSQQGGGYSYREIMEAVRLHDLPENEIGDWLDNGTRDENEKTDLENQYYANLRSHYDERDLSLVYKACRLINEMRCKKETQPIGRLLYAADKYSAVITALTYDALAKERGNKEVTSPAMHEDYPYASERDHAEMAHCDYFANGYHKASEMFTADILHVRKLNQYDDTGFFTGLLVMYTLMVNGHWYKWREHDYEGNISH